MIRKTLLTLLLAIIAFAASAQTEPVNQVEITAKIRTYVLKSPRADAEFLRGLTAGASERAFGRDASGDWLRILDGWVLAEVFRAGGDMAGLPDATHSVNVTVSSAAQLYDGPSAKWFEATGEMTAGSKALAIGRNESGSWLRLPQGWIEVAHVEAAGDIRPLPVAPSGVIITATQRTFILAEPDLSAEFVDVFEAGEEALATGRAGDWLQIAAGWVSAAAVDASGDPSDIPFTGDGIRIVSNQRYVLSVRNEPKSTGQRNIVRKISGGTEETAIGRTENGRFLFIGDGWVPAMSFNADDDIMDLPIIDGSAGSSSSVSTAIESLPFTGEGIPIVLKSARRVRYSPAPSDRTALTLHKGAIASAIGRTADSRYIQVEDGWILVGESPSQWIEWGEGDIMDLPVTDGSAGSTSRVSTTRATATPRPSSRSSSNWTSSTIRSLVSRHTDDIRILDLELGGSVTTIEYDLKPWPFVPNESIANEVAFKIICALRRGQQIPNTLKLIGQGHFKSDIGRKFKSPSVEIHVRANNANRIICAGNSYSDINWRSLSSVYKSYPIPRGAKVDYD